MYRKTSSLDSGTTLADALTTTRAESWLQELTESLHILVNRMKPLTPLSNRPLLLSK